MVGWGESLHTAGGIHYCWMMNPVATYHAQLVPGTYEVRFRLLNAATDEVRQAFRFSVNGDFLILLARRTSGNVP